MVVDASVWVAAFLVRDAHRAEVLEFLRRVVAARAEAAIPALALAEIGGAIARRSSAPEPAVAAVDFIRAQDWIEVVPVGVALGEAAARLAIRNRLRGADAAYAALAAIQKVPLVTLDREIIDRAGDAFVGILPAQWSAGT